MTKFVKGLELCESFFNEYGLPVIQRNYPNISFSAGLLGWGSDVLGYDNPVSTDHMWGPRFYLFLKDCDIHIKDDLMDLFGKNLPYTYKGFSVNFSTPNPNGNGVRHAEFINSGHVSPLIEIYTINEFINKYLGMMPVNDLEWLSVSEHRLLGFTSGKLFIDMLNISEIRNKLLFYPRDVKLYLIASQWSVIAEEQAFVKRCSDRGDDLGSRIICSRIAERLMRLCFLYEGKYAPYSKWFGTGFRQLTVDGKIYDEIEAAISANTTQEREKHILEAKVLVAALHNASCLTEPLEIHVQKYYGRDIGVIFADKFAEKTKDMIFNPVLKECPLIGSLSQIGNFAEISDNPLLQDNVQRLYLRHNRKNSQSNRFSPGLRQNPDTLPGSSPGG